MNADTGEIDWYYQHLPCDDWDQDFVQERTLIDTVVNPDPEAVRWINPTLTGTAQKNARSSSSPRGTRWTLCKRS